MMGEQRPVDELSAATRDVIDAFRIALDSLNTATTAHKRAAIMMEEEVRGKTGDDDAHR